MREWRTQARPPTIKPPETKNRKIQTKPLNVRERGTQAKTNVIDRETQANLPTIKPPKTKNKKTQIRPTRVEKKQTQTDPANAIVDENVKREINGIPHVDDNVDYENLEDPNQKKSLRR